MAIIYSEQTKTFTIHTEKSTYQMKVDQHGMLLHTYFGAPTDESDYSYLIVPEDRGFCGQPADAGKDRTYSMDFYPLEYPVHGNGDYRVLCLKAGLKGRVPALDLRFFSYHISKGKYALSGLPALFGGDEAETLEIVLKDLFEEIYVHLYYGVFEKKNVITRAAVVENRSKEPLEIKRAMSLCLDFMDNNLELLHFYGKHACERQFERVPLLHGIVEIGSRRGASSHQHNPFVILCRKETTEDAGACCGVSLLYSGSFRMQAEAGQIEGIRLVCGMDDDEFCWTLEPGGSFAAPEAVFSYTEQGFSDLSNGLKEVFHQNLIRSEWKDKKRPTLVNSWEAAYFDFNAEKLLAIAKEAAGIGLDMLVLDDGWFGVRNDDNSGLGDWNVNEEKLGCSLRELVERVNGLGLQFGIWVELEMISEDSDLYRTHPNWAMAVPGREPNRSRNQLVLDLSRAEVRQYIKNVIITEKVVKHPDRAEADRFFNFPYAAVEEALSNAVYHRAYDEREPIEVRVENDRIEIVSFPGPDRSVTMEGLKSYRVSNRRYRNRRIGDFLKELHLTEGRNTGFKKILDALEVNGSPKPEFETDEDRSYFITRLFAHEKFVLVSHEERKRSQKGAKKEPKKGAERKQAILAILAENPMMTQTQLMDEMNLTRKQVQKDMKELQEEGVLVREGTNRSGRWMVKEYEE